MERWDCSHHSSFGGCGAFVWTHAMRPHAFVCIIVALLSGEKRKLLSAQREAVMH